MKKIEDIIESEEFKIAIRGAIQCGIEEDYIYNGEDEVYTESFDVYQALDKVIEVIKEKLI